MGEESFSEFLYKIRNNKTPSDSYVFPPEYRLSTFLDWIDILFF